jgi:hypothetical protein
MRGDEWIPLTQVAMNRVIKKRSRYYQSASSRVKLRQRTRNPRGGGGGGSDSEAESIQATGGDGTISDRRCQIPPRWPSTRQLSPPLA